MTSKTLIPGIIINTTANNGRALKKWRGVKKKLLDLFPENELLEYVPPFQYEDIVTGWLERPKINCILYAGGDGTMNHLLNTLMNLESGLWGSQYFGGIGLGSSNDFQKPYVHFIENIPVRISVPKAKWSDIGWVSFENSKGELQKKYFLINASLGVTAAANLLFNEGDIFINFTKSKMDELAIIYTAIKTILTFKNIPITMRWNGQSKKLLLSNLAILKKPNISGSFKFSQPILPDDEQLGINVCNDLTKNELINVLYQLSKGRFKTNEKRWSFFAKNISLKANDYIPLETDGEVYLANSFEFGVLPQKINLLA